MSRIITIIALILALSVVSCQNCVVGEGEVVPEPRRKGAFTSVQIDGHIDVVYQQINDSEVDKVVVTAQENLMEHIKTEVDGGVLIVTSEECFETDYPVIVEVMSRTISAVNVNGSGDFKGRGKVKTQELALELNGSGDVEFEKLMVAGNTEVEISGSGDVILNGKSDYMEIGLYGSGDVSAAGFKTIDTEIELDGSGKVTAFVTENLEVEINGSGDVTYTGSPQVESSVNGSGKLLKAK